MAVDVDVAIVGYGPCGAVAVGLLGGMGVRTWACDKSTTIYDKPRAFALDHEIMRVFQQLGIHEQVLAHSEPFTPSEFHGVDGQLIKRFTTVEPPFPLAFPPSLVFNQPATEQVLRDHVATLPNVQVALGCELVALSQDGDRVRLQARAADGTMTEINARYVIACDGASSTVRGLVDIALQDLGFDEPWLVVDVMINDAGMRKLPRVSMQYCEPQRPCTYLVGPGRHRRWEIAINDGEDARQVATPQGTWQLLSRWITPDDATLWRQASYRFHALVAERWRAGRVFVAGDAAHQQPPFLGQGMCQGIRDVANLGWKLHAVLHGHAPDALLDSYGAERKAHVRNLTTRIKGIGRIVGERDLAAARARDAQLLAECGGVVPSVPRQDVQPALETGLLSPERRSGVGSIFPQPWLSSGATRVRMDEVCGRQWRVVLADGADHALAQVARAYPSMHVIPIGDERHQDADGVAARWFTRHGCAAAIVRPDHYVYGVSDTREQLSTQLQALQTIMYPKGDTHATTPCS
ncbi:bifunctional 3-(3-hydroxy-phenyl)propionate/3-hydroxycinnamic acid hydroxylase [Comamonadaceae bacterium G21597-S1]|nr:bifunctional 3-(3-hydroxy-phenyl)propionate/3-hydroxycinnamic acid hydroxylase [Comamonadaceae bacterium G21597-S1]